MSEEIRRIAEAFAAFWYEGRHDAEDVENARENISRMLATSDGMRAMRGSALHPFVNGWLACKTSAGNVPWCKTSSGAHAHGEFIEESDGHKVCSLCKEAT